MKFLFGISFLLLFHFSSSAQGSIFYCDFYGENATKTRFDICLMNQSLIIDPSDDSRVLNIVDQIMAEVGLPRNFLIVECPKIQNCKAVNYLAKTGSLRYIVYDKEFLEMLDTVATTQNQYWASVGIIAHEIGHHLAGHTLDSLGSRPDKELEADQFAGFALYKLGATLEQAQSAFSAIANVYGDVEVIATHPPLRNRLAAIRMGWNDAWSSHYRQEKIPQRQPNLLSLNNIAMELYQSAYLLNKINKHEEAIRKCTAAIHLNQQLTGAYIEKGLAEAELLKTADAITTLNAALILEPDNLLALVYKAKAYAKDKQYGAAQIYFLSALRKDSLFAPIYAERAIMYNEQGLYEKAINDANQAINLNYQDTHIPYSILGYSYLQKKEYGDASIYFSTALRYNPIHEYSLKWGEEAYKKWEAEEKLNQKEEP